jgi:cytochrome P450
MTIDDKSGSEPMHDWTGVDLRRMATLSDDIVEPMLKSLRIWLDATYPDGGKTFAPTDRMTTIVTADQLGQSSIGRRDACMGDFRAWLGYLRSRAADGNPAPEGPVRKLATAAARMMGYSYRTIEDGFSWMDDGKNDVLSHFSVGTAPILGVQAQVSMTRIHDAEPEAPEMPRF